MKQIKTRSHPLLLGEWLGFLHLSPYLFKDFTNVEVPAEIEAVGVEFFQYDHWVLLHFFCQEDMKTFIPVIKPLT